MKFKLIISLLFGFLSLKGQIIFTEKFPVITSFPDRESALAYQEKTSRPLYGLKDSSGNVILEIKYGNIKKFINGYAGVCNTCYYATDTARHGFIDSKGNEIIPLMYDGTGDAQHGLFLVKKGKKWGMVDRNNNVVADFLYDREWTFLRGFAEVEIDKKYGIIDTNGKIVVPIIYEKLGHYYESTAAVLPAKLNGKWGLIDFNGNMRMSHKYESMGFVTDGFVFVSNNKKYGYVDTNGIEIVAPQYTDVENFTQGRGMVNIGGKGGKYGFVDNKGKLIVPVIYDWARPYSDSMAVVATGVYPNEKFGFLDHSGKIAVPVQYEEYDFFKEGLAAVKKNGKWGFINKKNEIVIPFTYDFCWGFKDGKAKVTIKDNSFLIDKTGKTIEEIKD